MVLHEPLPFPFGQVVHCGGDGGAKMARSAFYGLKYPLSTHSSPSFPARRSDTQWRKSWTTRPRAAQRWRKIIFPNFGLNEQPTEGRPPSQGRRSREQRKRRWSRRPRSGRRWRGMQASLPGCPGCAAWPAAAAGLQHGSTSCFRLGALCVNDGVERARCRKAVLAAQRCEPLQPACRTPCIAVKSHFGSRTDLLGGGGGGGDLGGIAGAASVHGLDVRVRSMQCAFDSEVLPQHCSLRMVRLSSTDSRQPTRVSSASTESTTRRHPLRLEDMRNGGSNRARRAAVRACAEKMINICPPAVQDGGHQEGQAA